MLRIPVAQAASPGTRAWKGEQYVRDHGQSTEFYKEKVPVLNPTQLFRRSLYIKKKAGRGEKGEGLKFSCTYEYTTYALLLRRLRLLQPSHSACIQPLLQ